MKEIILEKFSGQYCTIDDVVAFSRALDNETTRTTVIWTVNELIKQRKATRIGRGVYSFLPKKQFLPMMSEAAMNACGILEKQLKYLSVTVTDSGILGQFMDLQPFATMVVIEARKSAKGAVLTELRKEGIDAYEKRDYLRFERYISSSQPFIVRAELSVNPSLPQINNVRVASLEKILVDLVCDKDIYGQYSGEELENIYQNAIEMYAVNYSRILKYAALRKKKAAVLEMLQSTDEFTKVRSFI